VILPLLSAYLACVVQEDIKKQLLEIDEQIQSVQERIQAYRVSQWNWVKRLVWLGILAMLVYAAYWKFMLPARVPPLTAGLYIAVFVLIPLLCAPLHLLTPSQR